MDHLKFDKDEDDDISEFSDDGTPDFNPIVECFEQLNPTPQTSPVHCAVAVDEGEIELHQISQEYLEIRPI